MTGSERRSRGWTTVAGAALVATAVAASGCAASRDEPGAEPAATVVVELPAAAGEVEASEPGASIPTERSTTDPADSAASASSGAAEPQAAAADAAPALGVPFADYFDVDPFGSEPVRGSGCGLDTFLGEDLPDGLWRGYVRSFDGLWVDAATSMQFDLACVYAGEAAADAEREWRRRHPGERPVEVPDGFLVNDYDRVRTVPLARSFVQVDAQWNDAGECAVPDVLPPSGATEVYRLLDSWVLVTEGLAQWAVTSCLPR